MKNTIESGIFFWRREGLFHDPFWGRLHQRKMPHKGAFDFLAEREGFEPPDL